MGYVLSWEISETKDKLPWRATCLCCVLLWAAQWDEGIR